jgi:mevalonate kinase
VHTFRSNGKLLLSAEYLVLKGALALALPLRKGQSLCVTFSESSTATLLWKAFTPHGKWLETTFEIPSFKIVETDDVQKSLLLQKILRVAKLQNTDFLIEKGTYRVSTKLDFDPNWGFGSSSTLVANIAQWAEIDAFELLFQTLGGSGYDVACALMNRPIFYHLEKNKPFISCADFDPPFSEKLFFVYLGEKQHSGTSIRTFELFANEKDLRNEITEVSEISEKLVSISDFDEFCSLMNRHEQLIASCTGQTPVAARFPDFDGTLKSLGAWGGDFALALSRQPETALRNYFSTHGLHTIFRYNEIVLGE